MEAVVYELNLIREALEAISNFLALGLLAGAVLAVVITLKWEKTGSLPNQEGKEG